MNTTEEKGVTLIALVTTIVILLILASVGYASGSEAINFANFSQFKTELEVLQTEVNELNQNNEIDVGQELTETQKNFLNNEIISDIIYNGKTEEEKVKIQEGFRYCNSDYIKSYFSLESVKRDYLINVEYRYVIYSNGFNYRDTTYYMVNQIDGGLYNVQYNDKNEKAGSFEVNSVKENDRWKIEVSDITYNGYVNNWQVKYRLEDDSNWKTANNLSFYVTKEGNYYVQVVYGDDINLGSKLVTIIDENVIE